MVISCRELMFKLNTEFYEFMEHMHVDLFFIGSSIGLNEMEVRQLPYSIAYSSFEVPY
jgi:hypothetical protein